MLCLLPGICSLFISPLPVHSSAYHQNMSRFFPVLAVADTSSCIDILDILKVKRVDSDLVVCVDSGLVVCVFVDSGIGSACWQWIGCACVLAVAWLCACVDNGLVVCVCVHSGLVVCVCVCVGSGLVLCLDNGLVLCLC